MPRTPADSTPVHMAIADDLRAAIVTGTYAPGAKLPSETKLAAEYKVQNLTVRRSLKVLVAEGLVIAIPKRGNFVREDVMREWDMTGAGDPVTGRTTITVKTAEPDDRVMGYRLGELLDFAGGDLAVCRSRTLLVDDTPAVLADDYIPYELAKELTQLMGKADVDEPALLATLGHTPTKRPHTDELCPRMPTPTETGRLELPPSTPVMELVRRTTFTPGDRCLMVRHAVYTGGPGVRFLYQQ